MVERHELVAWRSRWLEVNAATDQEMRALSPAERLRDLARLRALESAMRLSPWPEDETTVWDRFQRLRSACRARLTNR